MILPNEIRRGANALDDRLVFAGREAAKIRPSEDRWCNGRYANIPTTPDQHPTSDILGTGKVEGQRKLAV
ncbi:hypothetical protein Cs7R123_35170 [Catellatospora sp. TT07R-123]|nr:hypothetical protein Cs7R123_35170 [Catellatospora sp. TT07R-123]